MVAVTIYLAVLVAVLLGAYIKYFFRQRRKGEPMIVPGNFIWGNGKDFAENAVSFIHKAQAKFGDIFTIRLLNQHLTIIADPHTYERVCKEKNFDFDPIQEQVNNNVFSFRLFDARKMIKEAGKKVKGQYLVANMVSFSKHLDCAFDDSVNVATQNENGWNEAGLRSMASNTMFRAIFRTIFGKGKNGDVFEPNTVYKSFDSFHKYFNFLWLGLPIKLFPNACRALEVLIQQPNSQEIMMRDDVSDYIKFSTEFMKANGQTETDIIGHNLVFLHVNYNTFRVTYWLIYYLSKFPEAREALREEINDLVAHKAEFSDSDEAVEMDLEDVEKLPVLNSIVNETIRYTSGVFMVRAITKDTSFEMENGEKFNLRAGDRVAMYPPAIHKDPEIFENPLEYKYDRFVDAKFYKNGRELKNPLLAFGSLCPGKKLAIAQAKWYIFNLVHQFDFVVADEQSCVPDVHYHGHEILPPTNDVTISYKRIENVKKLELVR
ncbi:cytochrome P450 7A1-like [Ruditapes philippinarum]|uniref:cytochrome P450 7A1-like n=1 Tax=Ruditapes philippinarum TaxID=129788 RepID=UPI00295B8491|nr:cytochrome P450 7A1-like [Ruditapes philippinarum]